MNASHQLDGFIEALYDYVQEPGWFMMKPTNSDYSKVERTAALFRDNADDIKDLCQQYLRTKDSIKSDFDLSMKEIVLSQTWQRIVTNHIAELGPFAGDACLLLD